MSHGNSHPVEENPKIVSTGAFYFVLLVVGVIIGLFFFVQTMSAGHDEGHDAGHGAAAHDDHAKPSEGHSWDNSNPLEYSTVAMTGNKLQEVKEAAPAMVTLADSAVVKEVATTDSLKVEKK